MVGVGSLLAGGRGTTNGVMCGSAALAAICLGKMVGTGLCMSDAWDEFKTERYEAYAEVATDVAELQSPDDHAEFMVLYGFSDASSAKKVRTRDLEKFREIDVPILEGIASGEIDYDDWLELPQTREWLTEVEEELDTTRLGDFRSTKATYLFVLLGIAAAFKVGQGFGRDD